MLTKKIKLDIYNRDILFVCGTDVDCKQYLDKKFGEEFDTSVYGFCGTNGSVLIIYINLTESFDLSAIIGTLSHEVFHAVLDLYDSIENNMNPDSKELVLHKNNTEPYAYLTGYIMEKAFNYIIQEMKGTKDGASITSKD